MKTRMTLSVKMSVAILVATAGFVIAGVSATPASAACAIHSYYPYAQYSYTASYSSFNSEVTESTVGSCDGDGNYHATFTVTRATDCVFMEYANASGSVDVSSCVVAGGGATDAGSIYRADRAAPLWFCAIAPDGTACFAGPFENRYF